MSDRMERIGNIYGYTGGNFAGNVYGINGVALALNCMEGGNRVPMILVPENENKDILQPQPKIQAR